MEKIPTSIPNFNIHSGTTLFHGRIYLQQKLQTEYDEESEGHSIKDLQSLYHLAGLGKIVLENERKKNL